MHIQGKATAVLVLYRALPEASVCFTSLRDCLVNDPQTGLQTLLLYDNSLEPATPPAVRIHLVYQHDAANGGVAAAYNAGLEQARSDGSEWLLLLDQDTALTSEYLAELSSSMASVPPEVSAIIPRLVQDGETHSPQTLPRLSHKSLHPSQAGLLPMRVSAFNSGAALRVSAIKRFPDRYWLDFLDHAVFHELQANGGRIWLMQARLPHSLSTQKLGEDASLQRYLNVLQAERDFYREYGSVPDALFYRLRRTKQAVGHLLKVPDKRFALLSLRAALGLLPPTPTRAR